MSTYFHIDSSYSLCDVTEILSFVYDSVRTVEYLYKTVSKKCSFNNPIISLMLLFEIKQNLGSPRITPVRGGQQEFSVEVQQVGVEAQK